MFSSFWGYVWGQCGVTVGSVWGHVWVHVGVASLQHISTATHLHCLHFQLQNCLHAEHFFNQSPDPPWRSSWRHRGPSSAAQHSGTLQIAVSKPTKNKKLQKSQNIENPKTRNIKKKLEKGNRRKRRVCYLKFQKRRFPLRVPTSDPMVGD